MWHCGNVAFTLFLGLTKALTKCVVECAVCTVFDALLLNSVMTWPSAEVDTRDHCPKKWKILSFLLVQSLAEVQLDNVFEVDPWCNV